MKITTLVILTIWAGFAFTVANAQSNQFRISGKIITSDNKPVQGATIVLSRITDSSIVKINQSTMDGQFVFEQIRADAYRLSVTSTGLLDYRSKIIHVDSLSQLVELPLIILQHNGVSLQEVKITGKKPFIEQKIDRTVVNVGAMISATGDNALELLEKLPGVVVDQNGNISFKGKSGVMILIDGKQTYLSGDNLASYLKSLQASPLDQVELMPNPPAKYEASGNAGVINIKTKKSKVKGFNGSMAVSIGKSRVWRTNESFAINYRSGKINLFANTGFGIQHNYRKLSLQRNYFDPNGELASIYTSLTYFKPTTYNRNIKTGIDYYLSSKKTIGLVFTGSWANGPVRNPGNSSIYNGAGAIDSTIVTDSKTKNKFTNGGINLNYSQQFDSLGKAVSVDVDYITYKANSDQSFLNTVFYPNGGLKSTQLITDDLPASVIIYSAKTDFTQPLPYKGQLEAGLKASYVSTDNEANYYTNQVIDYDYTNHFLYKENINAAYLNFRKELKRVSFQTGWRLENTNIKGRQLGNPQHPDSNFTQHYTGLFPTAFLSYKIDTNGRHLLRLSYGKRIDRPYYKDLNPFVTIVDKFTNFAGNPYLKPQQSSNYELTYSFKSIFSVSLAYSHTNNYQIETIRQEGDIFISSTTNLGSREYKTINASATFNPAKWWNCNLYSEVVQLDFESVLFDNYLNAEGTYYYIEGNNQFDLANNWGIQLSGYWISARVIGQFMHEAKGALNIGVQKKILKNKASLKLSASDILHTTVSNGSISNITGATSTYRNDFDNRMVTVGVSYNFGKSANNARKRNTGSSQSEQNRVKN
jgi:hypothetical protein